jgi:HSP20 family protein
MQTGIKKNPTFFGETIQEDFLPEENTNEYQNEEWYHGQQEGELAVDVLENQYEIVVISTIAGAKADSIEVFVHDDLLTIKGSRELPLEEINDSTMHLGECWGPFSRTIVLPVDVQGHRAQAEYKNGILKITIPKQESKSSKVQVVIVEE